MRHPSLASLLLVVVAVVKKGANALSLHELNRRDALNRVASTVATITASGLLLPVSQSSAQEEATTVSPPATTTTTTTTTSPIPKIKLGKSNLEVSRTIQGYWQLAGGHGKYREQDAIDNMQAHLNAGITTLDTADIYGPSELIIGKFVKNNPTAVPCTKFCCFRFLEDIDRAEVKLRIQKVRMDGRE
jgi:hypothetical protein